MLALSAKSHLKEARSSLTHSLEDVFFYINTHKHAGLVVRMKVQKVALRTNCHTNCQNNIIIL